MTKFLDPRIKAFSESKYNEFRNWFDQRLDDAIAAAETEENSSPGIYNPSCSYLSTIFLF